jgi:hypothetical protein
MKILEPEIIALQHCLKACLKKVFLSSLNLKALQDTVIKTGQVYSFYADTGRLCVDSLTLHFVAFFTPFFFRGIEKHAPKPPQSLTVALGRDIERYDQLCDAIEAHLASPSFHKYLGNRS